MLCNFNIKLELFDDNVPPHIFRIMKVLFFIILWQLFNITFLGPKKAPLGEGFCQNSLELRERGLWLW